VAGATAVVAAEVDGEVDLFLDDIENMLAGGAATARRAARHLSRGLHPLAMTRFLADVGSRHGSHGHGRRGEAPLEELCRSAWWRLVERLIRASRSARRSARPLVERNSRP